MIYRHYLHTGQRSCHADDGREIACDGSGQDASFAVGVPWPEPRFELRDDEVMDRLTGLIWCRSANPAEFPLTWREALDFVASMNREQRFGQHDWRMPNRRELRSLLSLQTRLPALPERHPFVNVFDGWYWTDRSAGAVAFFGADAPKCWVEPACRWRSGLRRRDGPSTPSAPSSAGHRCRYDPWHAP